MMGTMDPFNDVALGRQVKLQKERAWDMDLDLDWSRGVDLTRGLLPVDLASLGLEGASAEEVLAVSQFLGLIVNNTISEMECVLDRLKDCAWADQLKAYSVNPEMWDLGELFFVEERKHSQIFQRYLSCFCEKVGVAPAEMRDLLPQAFGARFADAIMANAKAGGIAFWWVCAAVEEVSIKIWEQMYRHRTGLDPLFLEVHQRHLEEEARHANYAFLMLNLYHARQSQAWIPDLARQTDLLLGEIYMSGWVLAQLARTRKVTGLRRRHPFFDALHGALQKINQEPLWRLIYGFTTRTPYVSLLLNRHNHREREQLASQRRLWRIPWPKPLRIDLVAPGSIPASASMKGRVA